MDTKKLRQKILDLAIHGRLVPQDPNDEPASVLLERIREEKERLIKAGKIKRSKQAASSDLSSDDVPFELPEGWCWCRLSSTCSIFGRIGFRGYTKDDLVDSSGAITLSPSNIVNDEMNYEKCTYISWDKYYESPEIQVKCNDILLVKTGSSYGKCALVKSLPKESTINPQFVVIKYIGCNNQYLTYCLQSNYARKQYEEFVLGTAIPTFTQVALGAMFIPLPPLAEQKRIVSAVEQWMSVIDVLENNEEDLRQSIDKAKSKILDLAIRGKLVPQDSNDEPASDLLKRLGISPDNCPCEDLPKGWTAAYLSELCTNINGLWKGKKEPFVNIGIIRNANFTKDFKLDYSNIEYLDVEEKSFSKRSLNNGDLIVEKSGGSDKNPVGRAVLYEGEDGKYSFSNFTMALRVRNFNVISSKYLYYFILNMYKLGAMSSMQTQTTGLHNLILDKYLAIEVSLPPLAEQHRIVAKIEQLYSQLDEIESSLQS